MAHYNFDATPLEFNHVTRLAELAGSNGGASVRSQLVEKYGMGPARADAVGRAADCIEGSERLSRAAKDMMLAAMMLETLRGKPCTDAVKLAAKDALEDQEKAVSVALFSIQNLLKKGL